MSGGLAGRGYVPALDGLRALAVIGVLVFHDDRLGGGFLGVDLFFAVSGLLITSLLIDEHDRSGTIDLIGFWGRRLRRLLPAALMLLVATVIVFRLFADTGEWIVARTDAPWAQFYVANWHLIASGNSYWDSFAAPSAFEHLWSLAIEEQFYLVWPVVVMVVLARWQLRDLTVVVAVGTILSIAAMVLIFDGGDPTRVYMGTDTRAFSLLVGALFALPAIRGQIDRFVGNRARFATVIAVSLLGGIGVMWVVAKGSSDWLFRGGLPAHSAMSALLAAFVVSGLTHVSSVLSARPLVAIGRLSYSLYLWHWPVFVFVNPDRFALDRWLITAIRFAVSLVLSVASYRLVEKPVRFRAPWAHGSRGRATFAVSMLVAVIVWVAIPVPATTNAVNDAALTAVLASNPMPVTTPPISPVTSTIPASTTTTAPLPPATSSTSTSTTTTTTIAPSGPPVETLLWYGDSIANDTWPPLGAALTEAGVDARSAAFGGVGLVAREGFDDPFGVLTGHLDEVDPDLLVMQLSLWDGYESSENQVAAFDELGQIITERNLRLALVTIPVRSDDQADPGEAVLVANAEQFAAEHRNLVVLLDQTEVFGDTFRLDIDGDGNPERKRDGVHLCPTGALAITFWLVKQLSVNYEGIAVPESSEWILGDWRNAERYDDPPGACAGL
ncbi:MAG: acyltransferase [Actinomycetota bacterium]|nr:acyltransferase [Actinomycetota bacterium]